MFTQKDYHMDREAKTWRPLRLNKSGEVERTDVSEPIVETLTAMLVIGCPNWDLISKCVKHKKSAICQIMNDLYFLMIR